MKLNLKILRIDNRMEVRGTTLEDVKESLRLDELTDEELKEHGFHKISDEMRSHMRKEVTNYLESHTHYKRVLKDTKFYLYNPDTVTLTILRVDGDTYWQYGKDQVNEYVLRDLGEYIGGLENIDIHNFNVTSKVLGDTGVDVKVNVGNKQLIGWLTSPTAVIEDDLPPKISRYFKHPNIEITDDRAFVDRAMKEGNVTESEILRAFDIVLEEYTNCLYDFEDSGGYADDFEREHDLGHRETEGSKILKEYYNERYGVYGEGCEDCSGDCDDCEVYDDEDDWA